MKTKIARLVLWALTTTIASCQSGKNLTGTVQVKKVISATKWIHIQTLDAATKADVTEKYPQFTGIGQYNADGSYEFFTADNKPKGDKGNWSITDNYTAMKITSATFGYSVSPKLILANKTHLNFGITVRDNTGRDLGEVIAVHIPYKEK